MGKVCEGQPSCGELAPRLQAWLGAPSFRAVNPLNVVVKGRHSESLHELRVWPGFLHF